MGSPGKGSGFGWQSLSFSPFPSPSVFGHISFRSDWELVKVDFRPVFSRPCREDDYDSWDLTGLQVSLGAPSPPPGRLSRLPFIAVSNSGT